MRFRTSKMFAFCVSFARNSVSPFAVRFVDESHITAKFVQNSTLRFESHTYARTRRHRPASFTSFTDALDKLASSSTGRSVVGHAMHFVADFGSFRASIRLTPIAHLPISRITHTLSVLFIVRPSSIGIVAFLFTCSIRVFHFLHSQLKSKLLRTEKKKTNRFDKR